MNSTVNFDFEMDLDVLCVLARNLTENHEHTKCFRLICRAMEKFPDAPHPHNLLGILCEKEGNHNSAMKHFRAAYSLDPSYEPARKNLNTYGTFFSSGKCDYGITPCAEEKMKKMTVAASCCHIPA